MEIRAGQLLLRPPCQRDLAAVVAACQDPEIPRFIPYVPLPYSQQDGKTWLAEVERKWESSDERTFAIVDQESNRFLGAVAIRLRDGGSLGYWLSREARGKGVMTEAVAAVVEWARTEHGIERLYIVAHPDNVASSGSPRRQGSSGLGSPPTGRRTAMARARLSGSTAPKGLRHSRS